VSQTTFRPDNAKQVAEAVSWAIASEAPLDVTGSGSKRGLGRPVTTAHRLDLSSLRGIVDYEPEELVLTAKAGTPLAEVKSLLKANRQHLAFEPPDYGPLLGMAAEKGTLGGLIASGLAGSRRFIVGSTRDHTLGFEAINGHGDIYRAGGKVVKNVTGYDVAKLMAGSFGTLSALTEISLKVLPAPEDTQTIVFINRSDEEAVALMVRAMQSAHEISGAAHYPADVAKRSNIGAVSQAGGAVTMLRLEGFEPSVAARAASLKEELHPDSILDCATSLAVWKEIGDVQPFAGASTRTRNVWRISVPPARGANVAASLKEKLLGAEYYFDWSGGLIWLAMLPDVSSAAIIRDVVGVLGHATLIRASEEARATVNVFQPLDEGLMLLSKRVKQSFDPKNILSPGRMYADV